MPRTWVASTGLVARLPLFVLLTWGVPGAAPAAVDPTPIVDGIDSLITAGAAGPLFWTDPEVVPIVAGDEDTPVPRTYAVARDYGAGRVVAIGHDGLTHDGALGYLDNRRFVLQAFDWLDVRRARRLAITIGHGEGLTFNGDSLRAAAEAAGWSVELLPAPLDAAALAPYSVAIFCNGVGLPPTAAECGALRDWVEDGGGLFLQGCGWGYLAYHAGATLDDYPMNQLAAPFGIRWTVGSIDDPTDSYLGNTLFHHFHPDLVPPRSLAEALQTLHAVGTAHAADLPVALEADPALRGPYVDSHLVVRAAELALSTGAPERPGLYDDYRDALEAAAPWYERHGPYDGQGWPHMTRLRERAAVSLADAAPLTPSRRQEIARTLGLAGARAELWLDRAVLLLDDCRLDSAQVGFIHALLDSIPPELHNLRAISVDDLLPRTTPFITLVASGSGSCNVFAAPVGGVQENWFPFDAPPWPADQFSGVVAHEVGHQIDAHLRATDPLYRAHRDGILARAGADSMNYCRVGNPGGFQGGGEVEFLASHSQLWFPNSALMMDLGIARFEGGRPCPIEDPYLFAEVLSEGGPFTRFYRFGVDGVLTTVRVPVGRDGAGRITDLWYDGRHVYFGLGADGRIVSIDHALAGAPASAPPPRPRLEVWPNPAHGEAWVKASGLDPDVARVALYDLSGRCVARGRASGEGLWRLGRGAAGERPLPPGLYLVRLEGPGFTLTARVVMLG